MNIFIGSLPFAVKDEALKELFATYGEVSSARVVTDKFTGRSKGFGFVEMEDEVAAKKAIAELNGSEIQTHHRCKRSTTARRTSGRRLSKKRQRF